MSRGLLLHCVHCKLRTSTVGTCNQLVFVVQAAAFLIKLASRLLMLSLSEIQLWPLCTRALESSSTALLSVTDSPRCAAALYNCNYYSTSSKARSRRKLRMKGSRVFRCRAAITKWAAAAAAVALAAESSGGSGARRGKGGGSVAHLVCSSVCVSANEQLLGLCNNRHVTCIHALWVRFLPSL